MSDLAKASKVIAALQKAIETHGDLPVGFVSFDKMDNRVVDWVCEFELGKGEDGTDWLIVKP
ncbi:MAG: hypothetical protein ACPHN2_08720 [Sinimarinibacterium flocculans]|uniref:hypothetical protein n=1 Tax=Sinimarinibacterium flocculans TaxID=985250 RepID=UPI003C32DF3D